MKKIYVLEPGVANKIAAGEVIERPASIVKELLENSLDAGASSITVEIRGGGVDYIRVTDNGGGIDADDVPTAFLRHATSKLSTAEELNDIQSFGFRGEALASIAAVAKVSLRTRTADAEYGTHFRIEGGKGTGSEPCACPVGTTIEINELFYNVPARLKFIKSERTESAMIMDYVSRLMLANPDIAFRLISNSRTVLQTGGSGDLSNCIFGIYGSSVFSSLYKIDYDDGYIRIDGYVGGESIARANRTQQSVFVNKRYIKSALVSNAVQRAFLTRLMNHRFPFLVLDLLISSREIDVNVHPNKLSVRFRDEERVANAVTEAVKKALSTPPVSMFYGVEPDAKAGPAEVPPQPKQYGPEPIKPKGRNGIEEEVRELLKNKTSSSGDDFTFALPKKKEYSLKDSGLGTIPDFDPKPKTEDRPLSEPDMEPDNRIPYFPVFDEYKKTEDEKPQKPEQTSLNADQCRIIGTAFDTYIIVQQGDSIFYIDQHAAHERLRYERLITGKLKFDSQLLAMPMVVDLDPIAYSCVAENIERFEEFGYSIDTSVDNKLRVDAVPNIPAAKAEKFLREVIDCVMENADADEIDIMRAKIIQMSCKGAVKAGESLDIRQLQAIVDAYSDDTVPLTCPHGRPVMIRVRKYDLQKMFKRIL